jgi:nicotinamidase-related amidase
LPSQGFFIALKEEIMTTALLIIDVQTAILAGKGTPERQPVIEAALEAMTERLAALQAKARSVGVTVILIQHDGTAGHRLETGSAGWTLCPKIAPQKGDIVVHKSYSDSFFATDLNAQLIRHGVDHLVIGGCMTEYCIDTTIRRALSMGYDVTALTDGHTTADANGLGFDQIITHHNAIFDGFDAGAKSVILKACADVAFET